MKMLVNSCIRDLTITRMDSSKKSLVVQVMGVWESCIKLVRSEEQLIIPIKDRKRGIVAEERKNVRKKVDETKWLSK